MAQVTVQIQGGVELTAWLEEIATELGIAVESLLEEAAIEGCDIMRSYISTGPYSTGALKDGIRVLDSTPSTVEFGPSDDYYKGDNMKFAPSQYGKAVDQGGGPTEVSPNYLDIMYRFGVDERTAFAMAKKMRERGTSFQQARNYIAKTEADMEDVFFTVVTEYLDILVV